MNLIDLSELIKSRRSIRRWQDRPVSEQLVMQAIELAIWAPNGGNYQGWYFIVVLNRDIIDKIADCVQAAMNEIASWPEARPWKKDIDRYRESCSFFRNAPALVAAFAQEYQSVADKVLAARETHDPKAARMRAFRMSAPTAIQSVASAITNMLLAFHAMNLGAVWLAVPLLAKEDLENLLHPPSRYSLVACVAVGYPDEYPDKDRKPLESIVKIIKG